ncbi:MAG: flagellar motor protein [Pseudomonadales bacterium]
MDVLAIAGAALGFLAIIGGSALEGLSVAGLANLPAAVIVLGGTFGAVVLQTPAATLRRAWNRLRWVATPPPLELERLIDRIGDWSRQVRRGGLVSLEEIAGSERDPFIRAGIQMVADGSDLASMRRTLELENDTRLGTDLAAAQVYRSMGGYAPTIGIVGAVLGLIQVMGHLDDPDQLGIGIATAFIATIYGVGSANLVFLPLADRLRAIAEGQWQRRAMVLEGLMCLTEGEHPSRIRARLNGYLSGW